ncbi:pregnancy zone protein-like [Lutra lutra]|uniref:pregnancy zone protein-like n=1 Tax=Lutra lutra TaxID=9657 RepID=UPI001FD13B7E|nr:pregnancy zone protein-like [Lutra lutra]
MLKALWKALKSEQQFRPATPAPVIPDAPSAPAGASGTQCYSRWVPPVPWTMPKATAKGVRDIHQSSQPVRDWQNDYIGVHLPTFFRQCVVLGPSLLHTGTPENGCLLLSYLNETVSVSASLECTGGNQSLFTDPVVEKDLYHCVSFTLPRISSSSQVAFLTVQIKGPTQDFRKKSTVLVKNAQSLVFAQTNKPIYKPGQTELKFHIASVDENFHPLDELISLVYLEDTKRNQIRQSQSLRLESGLQQLAFPVSSEPIQGSYKVVVQKESGERIEHPFTVQEFVLPKFEVKVQVPKIISILDEKVNISVCGM